MAIINLARAIEQIPNFNSADNVVLTDIMNACSDVIEAYCYRTFAVMPYDEMYDGPGYPNLILNNYPIVQVSRISFNPVNVVQIRNTDQGVSRASFRIDADASTPPLANNLYLVSLKNGVETDITINLQTGATTVNGVAGSTYTMVTLANLATAISAFSAYGWASLALGIYTSWPITDLWPFQGAKECRWFGNAYITHHSWDLPEFTFRASTGEVAAGMGFPRGYQNFRIFYTAGFAVIPFSVQQACADLTASVYNSRGQNPALQSESLGGYSYSMVAEKTFRNLDFASRYGLELYRNRRVAKFKMV